MKGITLFALLVVVLATVAAAPQRTNSSILQDKLNQLKLKGIQQLLRNKSKLEFAFRSTLELDLDELDYAMFVSIAYIQGIIDENFTTLLLLMVEHEPVQLAIIDIMRDTYNSTAMGYFDFIAKLEAATNESEIRKAAEEFVVHEKNAVVNSVASVQELVDDSASEYTDITQLVGKYTIADSVSKLQPVLDILNRSAH